MSDYKMDNDNYIQIDVKRISDTVVVCNLYTGVYCPEIIMKRSDYDYLVEKGFFIRDGKKVDDAGIMNTTEVYMRPKMSVTGA